jgi:hypothetical protein
VSPAIFRRNVPRTLCVRVSSDEHRFFAASSNCFKMAEGRPDPLGRMRVMAASATWSSVIVRQPIEKITDQCGPLSGATPGPRTPVVVRPQLGITGSSGGDLAPRAVLLWDLRSIVGRTPLLGGVQHHGCPVVFCAVPRPDRVALTLIRRCCRLHGSAGLFGVGPRSRQRPVPVTSVTALCKGRPG